MAGKTIIYPLFLPHAGCPFQCVYCNQNVVTRAPFETDEAGFIPSAERSIRLLAEAAGDHSVPGEIAFYGGTFTALPEKLLIKLLDMVAPLVSRGRFSGIRFSTRPDRMTPPVCELLAQYPVRTVELGVQSLSDEVLLQSRRGYDSDCVRRAVEVVRERGWSPGIQLMPGLPGDNLDRFRRTVADTVALRPDFVRIYPTVVLAGTVLARWFDSGIYHPLTLETAVSWCAEAYATFLAAGIKTARMGLHADAELQRPGNIVAGPFHPSFGYLVRVRLWRDRVDRFLCDIVGKGGLRHLCLTVPESALSEVLGPGRENVTYWLGRWRIDSLDVTGKSTVDADHLEYSLEETPRSKRQFRRGRRAESRTLRGAAGLPGRRDRVE